MSGLAQFRWPHALALLTALTAAGCAASLTAPDGVLPTADASMRDVRGAWVQARTHDGRVVPGELLAVGTDSVYILPVASALAAMPRGEIASARVEAYRNGWERPAGYAALGALSTVSHGFGLGATAPLWAAVGIGVSRSYAQEGLYRVPERSWESLSMYARYPQGLPAGLPRSALRFLPARP